jgi:hypothetical protein
MTTRATDLARPFELGDVNEFPVIASDIIYEGSAVGDNASGYARPLAAGDRFLGFAESKADNSDGDAGDINIRVRSAGKVQLSVTDLAITDVGRPVYASDDDTFNLTGIGSFVGYVYRYVSAGVGIVVFNAAEAEKITILAVPITLSKLANGDIVTTFTPGFNGRVKDMKFIVHDPVTTAAKLSTLNAEIGTTNITGGTVALTSAACTPLGKVISAEAITAGAGFKSSDTISIEAASTTAFVEGTGVLEIILGS